MPALRSLFVLLPVVSLVVPWLPAADQPQWGEAWSRNMVSIETGLPATFDPVTKANVCWTARLGTEAHSTPVVSGGRVFIGTNNGEPRDAKHSGDRGVLMCFEEKDGALLWQLVVPKRDEDKFFDWPNSGISSPATIEGERVYVVSNRGEVMCLDARGLANGNDGPFVDEGAHMTPRGQPALEPGPLDADILWLLDLKDGAGIWPHDAAHSSILIHGHHLYLNSGTGVDNTHRRIRTPDAPSLVVIDKATGRLLARDRENIAPNIFHSTWSSPSLGTVDGRTLVFFAGGNGFVYAFEPLADAPPPGEVATLKKVWQFDFDPGAPKTDVHRFNSNRQEGPSNIFGMPVLDGGKLFVTGGGDIWWGKTEAWLKCLDPAGRGDITTTHQVWAASLEQHVLSTPAVHDGLVFIADTAHFVRCLDAVTGLELWTHDAGGPFWASPYVCDGKVFIGTRRGDFWTFAASKSKKVLGKAALGSPISATATAANGVLYVATMKELFAVAATPESKTGRLHVEPAGVGRRVSGQAVPEDEDSPLAQEAIKIADENGPFYANYLFEWGSFNLSPDAVNLLGLTPEEKTAVETTFRNAFRNIQKLEQANIETTPDSKAGTLVRIKPFAAELKQIQLALERELDSALGAFRTRLLKPFLLNSELCSLGELTRELSVVNDNGGRLLLAVEEFDRRVDGKWQRKSRAVFPLVSHDHPLFRRAQFRYGHVLDLKARLSGTGSKQ